MTQTFQPFSSNRCASDKANASDFGTVFYGKGPYEHVNLWVKYRTRTVFGYLGNHLLDAILDVWTHVQNVLNRFGAWGTEPMSQPIRRSPAKRRR